MTLEENQHHVQQGAMDRYVDTLEKEAREAVLDSRSWESTVKGGLDQEVDEKRRRREQAQANQALLKSQMESNKGKRADLRREYIHAASSHSFPLFTETFIDVEEFERIRQEQKQVWREELDMQSQVNNMLRNVEEKKHRELVQKKQIENFHTMKNDRGQEVQRLARQGRDLVRSWERDLKLKGLRKAMETGQDVVKDVEAHRRQPGRA